MVSPSPSSRARRERVVLELDFQGLSLDYLELFDRNGSRDLPYHGNEHQLAVAAMVGRGARLNALPEHECRALVVAALFHDFGYDLELTEEENIGHAVRAGRKAARELNPELEHRVGELIRATSMPHSTPLTLGEALLQDADLLMIAQPDFAEFLRGLGEERPGFIADPRFPGEGALSTEWGRRVYRTALHVGSSEHEVGYPPLRMVTLGDTYHEQVLTSRGLLIDAAIAPGVELLWEAGYETRFSCEGDCDSISPGYSRMVPGYIAFGNVTREQQLRLLSAASLVGRELEYFESSDGTEVIVLRFGHAQFSGALSVLLGESTPCSVADRLELP